MIEILLGTALLLILVHTYMVYRSETHNLVKGVYLICLVCLSIGLGINYVDRLGAPIYSMPPEFEYIHHISTPDNIIVWVYDESKDGYRLHKMDYSREAAKALADLKIKIEDGGSPLVRTETDRDGGAFYTERDGVEDSNNWRKGLLE